MGFTIPFVTVFVLVLLISPILFFVFHNTFLTDPMVKGASISAPINSQSTDSPINITVSSNSGTWDLFAYLCSEQESCAKPLDSGKRVVSVSGGITKGQQVAISYTEAWSNFKYVKIYVRPGWGSTLRTFVASVSGDDLVIQNAEYEGNIYEVVLIPVSSFKDSVAAIVTFSDR